MPGIKTSVWLGETERDQWKASNYSLTDIVKAGLAALGAGDEQPLSAPAVREIVREELAPLLERVDAKPDAGEVERIVSRQIQRAAGMG